MSFSTTWGESCGQVASQADVTVWRRGKQGDTFFMSILPRLISIAVRKYAAQPNDRAPAVRMLLHNAVRLAVSHLGREQARTIALEALQEPAR